MRLALVPFLSCWPGIAHAADYWVGGPGAADGNDGTKASPWATLERAAMQAGRGDTVNIRAGTYNVGGQGLYLTRSGIASEPVVFQSAPGETARINAQGVAQGKAPFILAGQHIHIKNLDIGPSAGFGVLIYKGSNNVVAGNTIHDSWLQGVFVFTEQGSTPWPSDNLIQGNRIYNNARENQARNKDGGWPGAISTQRATRLRVVGNTIYENWGEGIVFNLAKDCVATGNVVSDNFSANMYMDHATNCTFEKNWSLQTGKQDFQRNLGGQWNPGSGIQMANESYPDANPLNGNRIVNNIVVGGVWALAYGNYGDGGGIKNTVVAFNTFVGARRALIWIDPAAHGGAVITNNIFVQTGGPMLDLPGGASGISFKSNLWNGGASGGATGPGDVAGDPQFANAQGTKPEDFRIGASSPARGKAMAVNGVGDDFWGGARGNAPDIGAHQQGSVPAMNTGGAGGSVVGGTGGAAGMAGTGGKAGSSGMAGKGGSPGTGGVAGMTASTGGAAGSPNGGTGGAAGSSSDDDGGPPMKPDAGCDCSLGTGSRHDRAWWMPAAGLMVGWIRRRRRQGQSAAVASRRVHTP